MQVRRNPGRLRGADLSNLSLWILVLVLPASVHGQTEPYRVFDTKPVITEGPYLVAAGETTTTIVWFTDTPSHAKVLYGSGGVLNGVAEPQAHGLVPVGHRHVVHLTGLSPGTTYNYEVVATRVVKLKAYWPDKGLDARSGPHEFTTLDRNRSSVSFSVITDTHEDAGRINALNQVIDWEATEFLVHAGDAFHWIDTEEHLFRVWLRPMVAGMGHGTPLFFLRGNHEMRGPYARHFFDYVPTVEGRYYYARDAGPLHLMVLDTGEDKADGTNVYAELNLTEPYRSQELAWFQEHVRTEPRVRDAPFRVVLMHQPQWGWLADGPDEWVRTANEAGVDLVIAGHRHRYSYTPPGPEVGHRYHLLVLGQDQVAQVDADLAEIRIVVKGLDGAVLHSVMIPRS